MGSSQSKPQQQRARLHRQPQYEFHRIQPQDYNTWWLGRGEDGITDDALLKKWGCTKCHLCHNKIYAYPGYKYLIHNIKECKAIYHDECMRYHIKSNFVDRYGRLGRPQCAKCQGSINVRPIPPEDLWQNRALLKKNPTGFMKF